ncbi:hypothetical protein PV10_08920 [Exophiala mesophila]|uniref:EXPERA domain-containing protein n=1 Tax=Exophiala mesophila TaxID=212818 RepID=A0A0D1WK77_EXOME|nr:uncharacterized protein PV10_08920 [Exophiala mesophila]KIV89345.1 hypothetical protein PV10_08920 [Exophiala mesophila]
MVSTRHHPRPFPEPTTPTPNRATNGTALPNSSLTKTNGTTDPRKGLADKTSSVVEGTGFIHTITPLTMIWLSVSVPLVIWDTFYIFLRPHTMPGGRLHYPVWKPYALYGTVDYIYGWPAWNSHNGFTAAQGALNAVETSMYIYYLVVIFQTSAKGLYTFSDFHTLVHGSRHTRLRAPGVAKAVIILFSATIMTLSKTVLYWLNEYYSGFANIGHNSAWNLGWLWILPNGLWLVFPTVLIYLLGCEIINGLDGSPHEKQD